MKLPIRIIFNAARGRTKLTGLLLLGLILLLVSSCANPVHSGIFLSVDGQNLELSQKVSQNLVAFSTETQAETGAGVARADQEKLIFDLSSQFGKDAPQAPSTETLFLPKNIVLSAADRSLSVKIKTGSPVIRCEILEGEDGNAPGKGFDFFPPVWARGPGEFSLVIPISGITAFRGISFDVLPAGAPFSVLSASFGPELERSWSGDSGTLFPGTRLISDPEGSRYSFGDLVPLRDSSDSQTMIELNYELAAGDYTTTPSARLQLSAAADSVNFDLRLRAGTHSVYFYSADLGFVPRELDWQSSAVKAKIDGFRVSTVARNSDIDFTAPSPAAGKVTISPLPADLGTALSYRQSAWRQPQFELFSWNLFPDILIFDCADQDVQDLFFKRLAYFIEKKNTRGLIRSQAALADQRGWGANDYSAEGLAEFFNAAKGGDLAPNPEESLLLAVLLDNKILAADGTSYKALNGGIIAIARGVSKATRRILLQHESLHGIFFDRREFRDVSTQIYRGLSTRAHDFITTFFSFMGYDPGFEYLMINELQAYLLQQDEKSVRNYLSENMVNRYAQIHPDRRDSFRTAALSVADEFVADAHELNAALYRIAGVRNNELECLNIVE